MDQPLTLGNLVTAIGSLAALQFLVSLWLSERFKAALQRETGQFLESLRWDLKVREQAAKVAEYMALARDLREDSSTEDYRKANRLAWELALWLPPDVYRSVCRAIAAPDQETNPLSVVVEVRKVLLGHAAGNLTQDQILYHAPGAGRKNSARAATESQSNRA